MRSLHVVMASMARVAQISPLHDSIQADMAQGEGGRGYLTSYGIILIPLTFTQLEHNMKCRGKRRDTT